MGLATYAVVEIEAEWDILHDGYATKKSAFEAAVAATSPAGRQAHEVYGTVPSADTGNRTALGGASD